MPASPSAALLLLTLLMGTTAGAETPVPPWNAGVRQLELPAEPTGNEPEVHISPGVSTTLAFDAELLRDKEGKDTVGLEKREAFVLVDVGQATLRLLPSDTLKNGERLRLMVRFKDGAAPAGAAFTLVVHPARAERLLEVYRAPRTAASYQREAKEAKAEVQQCHEELERERAERGGPGGLTGLIAAEQMDNMGVSARMVTESVTKSPGNALVTLEVHSYRAAGRVVVELVVENPQGAQPWSAVGAMLTDRTGMELKVLPVWQRGFVETDRKRQHIVVEALATREEAQGSFTLKLWEAGMGRTVSLSGISFP
ncbi:DUF2381 family protein [Pyxidicoccus parkwayensis]|uniref:DUF2381 family protein n=1 Tax=Pyxidicoccus parkwayensis TaxID=2813578 RepID=A0ABX7P4B5_9BACT|nr:DUF2381 family protein [Pyxidicoccus parkwaysis]QSQ25271.1 DUF2381 family protein [Pyxidicoccus parkwaysis]